MLSATYNDSAVSQLLVTTILQLASSSTEGLTTFAQTMTEVYGDDSPVDTKTAQILMCIAGGFYDELCRLCEGDDDLESRKSFFGCIGLTPNSI
jgi:hypothetical protein